jgi:hypothetical protein
LGQGAPDDRFLFADLKTVGRHASRARAKLSSTLGGSRGCRSRARQQWRLNPSLNVDVPLVDAIAPFVATDVAPASPKRRLDRSTVLDTSSQCPIVSPFILKRHVGRETWHSHDWSPFLLANFGNSTGSTSAFRAHWRIFFRLGLLPVHVFT